MENSQPRIAPSPEAASDDFASDLGSVQPPRPEFTGYEIREDEEGIAWTSFPPPEDFDGEEQGEFGEDYYKRTLSPREQAVVDSDVEEELEEYRVAEAASRDRFFGFAGGEVSSPKEAETHETSGEEDERGEGPIEYKSMTPPPSSRRKPGPQADKARRGLEEVPAFAEMTLAPTSKPAPAGILADEPPGESA